MSPSELFIHAKHTLRLSHRAAADLLGISARTSQRWSRHGASATPNQFRKLAVAVYPRNAALAAELAFHGRTTLEGLGLVVAPKPEETAPRRHATEDVIDSVVCAAADAMGAVPAAVRPALLAACRRARRLGLDLVEVEAALGGAVHEPGVEARDLGAAPLP